MASGKNAIHEWAVWLQRRLAEERTKWREEKELQLFGPLTVFERACIARMAATINYLEVHMKGTRQGGVCLQRLFSALIICGLFLTAPAVASDATEAQGLVTKAQVTLAGFMADKNYAWLHQGLKKAKGILIYPQVLKAGFVLGGSGGTGVLLVKDTQSGNWSQPAFYTMGSVTFGLQIGGEAAEIAMLVMSDKAVDSLLASSVKLGADTSIALGPVGAGGTANIKADFISFAKTKGAYAGLNLQGSVVNVRDSLNAAYYGKEVRPVEIVRQNKVSQPGSYALRAALRKASE